MQSLSQLPSPDQAQQYYGGGAATPTPAPSNNTRYVHNERLVDDPLLTR